MGHKQFRTSKVWVRHDLAARGPDALTERFLEDNLQRRQLMPLRMAMVLRALSKAGASGERDDTQLKVRIAKQLSVSVRTIERWWPLLDLPPELFNLVALKKLPQRVAQLLLDYATPFEIEELRQAVEEEPDEAVVARAKRLAASRMEVKRRKIDPAKAFSRFLTPALDISAFHPEIAAYLKESDQTYRLKDYRYKLRRIMKVLPGILSLLESHPELANIVDDRPLEWSELTFDERVEGNPRLGLRRVVRPDDQDSSVRRSLHPARCRNPTCH